MNWLARLKKRIANAFEFEEEMSKGEMIERTKAALESFTHLPHTEQKRRMIAHGTIDIDGKVQMGITDKKIAQNLEAFYRKEYGDDWACRMQKTDAKFYKLL